jgi:hypothetical protein
MEETHAVAHINASSGKVMPIGGLASTTGSSLLSSTDTC